MLRVSLFVVCCACLCAQTAAVEGVVVNQVTGEPMAGVHVRLAGANAGRDGQAYGAMSDRAGHFSIASIPAGTYTAEGRQRGFFCLPPKGEGTIPRVVLKAAQQFTGLKIEMAQEAIVSGRITDDHGDPVQTGVRAQAAGERGSKYDGASYSDPAGEFRMRVAPGAYYLIAELYVPQRELEIRTDGTTDAIYTKTYYPGTLAPEKAVLVQAAAGAELTGLDIHLARQPRGASISGVVTGAGDALGSGTVTLLYGDSPHITGNATTPAGTEGHFRFDNLPPGPYRLTATHAGLSAPLFSPPADVLLEGSDISGVNLALAPGGHVIGKLEITGGRGEEKRSVNLQLVGEGRFQASALAVDDDGAFRSADLAPGWYRLEVKPMPEDAYLKSVRLDGVEIPEDGDVDLSRLAQAASLQIVVDRNGGQVSGKLLDKNGDPMVTKVAMLRLVPEPKDSRGDEREMVEDGTYIFHAVRPGKYRLKVYDEFRRDSAGLYLENEEVPAAEDEIEVREGERKVVDLKLAGKVDPNAAGR